MTAFYAARLPRLEAQNACRISDKASGLNNIDTLSLTY